MAFVVTVQQLRIQRFGLIVEGDQVNLRHGGRGALQCRDRDLGGTVRRKSEHTGRDRGEGKRPQSKAVGESQTASVARGKGLRLSVSATRPAWTNRVEDVPRRQREPGRYLRVSGLASAELGARGAQFGFAGCLVYGPIHSGSRDQVLVGRVDNRINPLTRDISANDGEAKGSRVTNGHASTIPRR